MVFLAGRVDLGKKKRSFRLLDLCRIFIGASDGEYESFSCLFLD